MTEKESGWLEELRALRGPGRTTLEIAARLSGTPQGLAWLTQIGSALLARAS